MKKHDTPQEEFWAGAFGDDYVSRNQSPDLLAAKTNLFAQVLCRTNSVHSAVEFGCNIGLNLTAISSLLPSVAVCGVEINASAAAVARQHLPAAHIVEASILEWSPDQTWDLAFTCGVMIHLNPDVLSEMYHKLASASGRYVLIAEYYNPVPVTVRYRGHEERLYKRDFAGEFLDANPDFLVVDYGFVWRRSPVFPLDDLSWFLLERRTLS